MDPYEHLLYCIIGQAINDYAFFISKKEYWEREIEDCIQNGRIKRGINFKSQYNAAKHDYNTAILFLTTNPMYDIIMDMDAKSLLRRVKESVENNTFQKVRW